MEVGTRFQPQSHNREIKQPGNVFLKTFMLARAVWSVSSSCWNSSGFGINNSSRMARYRSPVTVAAFPLSSSNSMARSFVLSKASFCRWSGVAWRMRGLPVAQTRPIWNDFSATLVACTSAFANTINFVTVIRKMWKSFGVFKKGSSFRATSYKKSFELLKQQMSGNQLKTAFKKCLWRKSLWYF